MSEDRRQHNDGRAAPGDTPPPAGDGAARRILLVDDEPDLLRAVRLYLEDQGYVVFSAENGRVALEVARTALPDLVVLDVRLPDLDGFEVLRRLREASNVPVVMLTVQGEEREKVRGLRLGADDYVTKPFSQRELAARIAAVLRRAEQPPHLPKTELVVDDYLRLDFDRNQVWAGGRSVALTPTEYRLLYHLASNPGRVLPFESLLTRVWGWEYRDEHHYVRLYVSYLRQKLEPDPSHPRYILTEKGLGYRFADYRRRRPAGGHSTGETHVSADTRESTRESTEASTNGQTRWQGTDAYARWGAGGAVPHAAPAEPGYPARPVV